jgi:anti-anti-sigma factor
MGITSQVSSDQKSVTISISGLFNASVHREFRDAYKDKVDTPAKTEFIVDLSLTEYMDSAALGMLLLLHEYAGGDAARVIIKDPNPYIRDILEIAKFDKIFTID